MSWDRTNDFDEMFSWFKDKAENRPSWFDKRMPNWKLPGEVQEVVVGRLIPKIRSTDTVYTLLWYGHRSYPTLSFTSRLVLKLKRVGRWLR